MFEKLNLIDTLSKNPEFSILGRAIAAAGLVDALKAKGPYTILAPTNDALGKFPKEMMDDLMKPENRESLAKLLNYHILEGKIMATDIRKLKTVKTLQGEEIMIDSTEGIKINGATVQARDYEAINGVIHAIDTALLLANKAKINR